MSYLRTLRTGTAYPTFRGVIRLLVIVGYLLAVIAAVTGLLMMAREPLALLFGAALAVLIVLLTHLAKEASLMLADIADAAIDMATNQARLAGEGEPKPNLDWNS